MRAITRVTQLAHARWTPCVALVLGSLLFVSLAIVVIPDRLGPIRSEARDPRTLAQRGAVASEPFQAAPVPPSEKGSPAPALPPLPAAASPQPNGANNALVGSLFGSTPAMELPVAPPDPAPPPPPAEVPPPAPTPTTFELPAPPPPPVEPAQTPPPAPQPETNAAQSQ